jgi:uncharacterized protein YkwD
MTSLRSVAPCSGRARPAHAVAVALLLGALSLTAPAEGASKVRTTVAGWSTSPVTVAADEALSRTVTVRTGTRTPERKVLLQFRAAETRAWQTVRLTPRTAVTVTGNPTGPGWDPSAYETEVLRLTNEIRAEGTTCGAKTYGPRPALTADPELGRASRVYAQRMGTEKFFDHVSPLGDDPGDRAEAAGYDWTSYGENIAAGQQTPAEVVEDWRESTGHCHNLMGSFAHLGVGYADVDGSPYGTYWVQLFGTPRR